MMTVAEAAAVLARAGVPNPDYDARVLSKYDDFDERIHRRAAREPLQYIVGSAPFRYLDVLVGPVAFIPRPETELLAGWVIDAAKALDRPVVVDLCCGPGTIALSMAHEVPGAQVYAVELDEAAAAWAQRNIEVLGLTVTLAVADMRDAFHDLDGSVDAVVCNPPYVVRGTIDQPEVADHEPAVALYDGGDGLAVIRTVVDVAARLLRPGGLLAVEHGDTQGSDVVQQFNTAGFVDVADHKDLTGRDRFTTGRKR